MGKEIYYIVQTSPMLFLRSSKIGYTHGFGRNDAHRFATLSEAWRALRESGDKAGGARRFPRVLKVTIEIKSINHI